MDIDKVYELMRDYSLTAGDILMQYRGKVENKQKEKGVGGEQSEGGLALTIVDEMVQEGFLWELYKTGIKTRINCEEETPLKELFRMNVKNEFTVHQDPCDGTKPYLEGKDDFATGYGISDIRNNFTHTVIHAPARGRIYIASPNENKILNRKLEEIKETNKPNYKLIFSKRALNERGKEEAKKQGFEVYGVESAHCRIIDVALRNAGAYLYGNANPHDSLIPYAFAAGRGISLFDVNEEKINVPVKEENGFVKFERIPSVIYISDENPHKKILLSILSDKKNLDEHFLN